MSNGLNLGGVEPNPSLLNMTDVFIDAICSVQPPMWQWDQMARTGLGGTVRMPVEGGGTGRYWAWSRNKLQQADEAFLRRLYSVVKYSAGTRDGRDSVAQPQDQI